MGAVVLPDSPPERMWALRKVAQGDWLCWSNDMTHLWRFHSYVDGKIHGLVVDYEARTFWRAVHLTREQVESQHDFDLFGSPWNDAWTEDASHLPTRQAAIERMLRQPEIASRLTGMRH